jgi:hypothetical protein
VISSAPKSPDSPAIVLPSALETGQHGFARGWLYTCRDVLFRPGRFFSRLGTGGLAVPLAFAVVSLTLPIAVAEIGSLQQGETDPSLAWVSVFKILLLPIALTLWIASVQAAVWQRVLRWFQAPLPFHVAARAMCFLTALAATLGLVMTLAGFAPESAPCVIAWYGSLDAILLLTFYALIRLARGPYALSTGRAILAVATFALVYGLVVFVAALAYFALAAALSS